MGHWEQIGRDNAKVRTRRAALSKWRRLLSVQSRAALVAASWLAAMAILLRIMRIW